MKITIYRELLEKAIESMDGVHAGEHHGGIEESIAALREALAQPQQEPEYIQLRHKGEDGFSSWGQPLDPAHRNSKWAEGVEMRLLFTSPPTSTATSEDVLVPLDILEAAEISLGSFCSDHGWSADDMQTMDNLSAYIAKHKAAHGIKESK